MTAPATAPVPVGAFGTTVSDMNSREVVVPDFWSDFFAETRIPAAVRIGDTISLTGHTGEDPDGTFPASAELQIRGTFRNLAVTLARAGATWADVVEIRSFHVGLRAQGNTFLAVAAEFLGDPLPVWTAVGVAELFDAEAVIEISCVAVVAPNLDEREPR
jgi:enamine deaminase RidA (YjgF/YER057c/UK114 family)